MKGDVNVWKTLTSLLLAMPAEKATKPLTRVARPKMEESSDWGRFMADEDEMSQASKVEKRVEVEMPPRIRPRKRIGR